MLTEGEAKTKWCPYARRLYNGAPVNRTKELEESVSACACIASACMAFRWLPDVTVVLSGNTIIVDQVDKDLLNGCWWDGKYARREDDRLHRLIAKRAFGSIPDGEFVDHIDGNTCNNRRGNLRIVTKAQNAANAASRGGISAYRGVSLARNGRWVAQISSMGVRKHLGTFDTEKEAAEAYDTAAKNMHGLFARPNLDERANVGRQGYCGLAGKP